MPSIRFDQGDTGTVNRSRSDIELDVEVDVFALGVVGTAVFGLLDKPPGAAAVFAGAGGDRQITPDVAGSYRVRIIDDDDDSEVIHTFTVRTALLGLDLPASNETANEDANDVENDAADILASESNEGGTFKGWHDKVIAALLLIEAAAARGAYFAGAAVVDTPLTLAAAGTGTVSIPIPAGTNQMFHIRGYFVYEIENTTEGGPGGGDPNNNFIISCVRDSAGALKFRKGGPFLAGDVEITSATPNGNNLDLLFTNVDIYNQAQVSTNFAVHQAAVPFDVTP